MNSIESIIKPKRPKGKGWQQLQSPPQWVMLGYPAESWFFRGRDLCVISAVEVANDENDIEKGPEFHVSVSKGGNRRATSNESKFVLKAFDIEDSDEDNHVPYGVVRNFWKPVATKFVGHVCPCKKTETAIKEDKGDFIWRAIK